MAKKLIHDYSFTPSSNTVIINEIVKEERLLLITNVKSGIPIYLFNDPTKKFNSVNYNYPNDTTTIVLEYNCNAMLNTDPLQIFVESDSIITEPSDTFIDAVSKLRVSTPENLIDTDFEYGLQSTKWETLERVKNIPTFFSRNGDENIVVNSMTTISGSDIVTVETLSSHNFSKGYPVLLVGTRNITCDGGFVVTNIINDNTFQYKAKTIQNFSGSILDTYTQLFSASKYQGTEFELSGINSIVTDEASGESKLTVVTTFPTSFANNTSFFLTNSISLLEEKFDAANNVTPNLFQEIVSTRINNLATGENIQGVVGSVQPDDYIPTSAFYFDMADVVFSGAPNYTLTFPTPHGFPDNVGVLWIPGNGYINETTNFFRNDNFGGGQMWSYYGYWLRRVDDYTFYLQRGPINSTRIVITAPSANPRNNKITKSCFARAYYVNYSSYFVGGALNYDGFQYNIPSNRLPVSGQEAVAFYHDNPYNNYNNSAAGFNYSHGLSSAFNFNAIYTIRDSYSGGFFYSPYVYYVRNGGVYTGGRDVQFTTNSDGSGFSSPFGGFYNFYTLLITPNQIRNSFYFPNHQLSSTDKVKFSANSGATLPLGLSNNVTYGVEVVNENRIRFTNDNGVIVNFVSTGNPESEFTISSNVVLSNAISFYIENSLLSDNTKVTYSSNGNSDIEGISNNSTYYVFQKQNNQFRLSQVEGGWTSNSKVILNSSSSTSDFITFASPHGFTSANNGELLYYTSSTPIGGLQNGAFYFMRWYDSQRVQLYYTRSSAISGGSTNLIQLTTPFSGTSNVQIANLAVITSNSTGEHSFSAVEFGAADGVYKITNDISSNTFEMTTNSTILARDYIFDQNNDVSFKHSSFYRESHGFTNKTLVTYETSGNAIGGLSNTSQYYTIVLGPDWYQLANSALNATEGTYITLSEVGDGIQRIKTSSVVGELSGKGTISGSNNEYHVFGTNTNFTSIFTSGDDFIYYIPANTISKSVTITTADDLLTNTAHGFVDGDMVKISASAMPGGLSSSNNYYIHQSTLASPVNTFTLHRTYNDAISNTNVIDITTTGTSVVATNYVNLGSRVEKTIEYIGGQTELLFNEPLSSDITDYEYAIKSSLLVRADGFALHRPYDGGVELIPSKNPDGNMIRQTRKYFRYQSGKGIQVSLAVNFSPTTSIDTYNRSGTTATITTRYPHRLSAGLNVSISGATTSGPTNYWNGEFTVTSVTNYSFTFELNGTPVESSAPGLSEFYVVSWQNSLLRCGLFDDQNGLFFEYDGDKLYCVRRSSTLQVSGTVAVEFKSSLVFGTHTKFQSQLSVGENIVIKGQTYKITQIDSDTQMYILPSYTGASLPGAIITKTVDTKVPQNEWNIDKADGTGPTGFNLDIHKIQMTYIDFSWYGAGKVRFGFKDQHGVARYFHEFIHGNKQTESYMRSGNLPSRYEILNVGEPTYVPALAHWGTSVIMDGRFDDDKAYIFTASSNQLNQTGSATILFTGRILSSTSQYFQRVTGSNFLRTIGFAIDTTSNSIFNGISSGLSITGSGLSTGTKTANPINTNVVPYQPYLPAITSTIGTAQQAIRNLIVLDRAPTTTSGNTTYTITLPTTQTVTAILPLISIRLAPSVDTGAPGLLGEREIINRMQLILDSVGILSTHSVEVQLILNGRLSTNNWQRVNSPSLSQLIYHDNSDTIYSGAVVYSFRAQGGTGTTNRTPSLTQQTLSEVATLGNSILGGDGVFPDGPDVLTIAARLIEDASTVSTTNPFQITGRISWTESQA